MDRQPREQTVALSSACSFPRSLRRFTLALLPTLLFCTMDVRGSATESHGAPGPQARHGEAIFHRRCVTCHNKQPGQSAPFGPPNLYGIFRGPSAITAQKAEEIIVHGKGAMPAWGGVLTRSDISDLIAYLRAR